MPKPCVSVLIKFLTNNPPRGRKTYQNDITTQAVKNTLAAIDAAVYIVRLIHDSKPPINKLVYPEEIVKEIPFYRAKNSEGYNIYFRPFGYHHILIDDLLTRDSLEKLSKIKPCLLLETSPANYQAWIKLKAVPQSRDVALSICKELAVTFGADMGSAEPDHLGRLPGFTNRKAKHRRPDGHFPFVKLHRWLNRESDFSPLGGIVGEAPIPILKQTNIKGRDRSREDFNLCCMLICQGKTDEFITNELKIKSEKVLGLRNPHKYIAVTIANARSRVSKFRV